MAEILLHNLAQRGVSVVRDLAVAVAGNGYPQAIAETPGGGLSFARHLSPSDPMLDPMPDTRGERANPGAGCPAKRAGRPGSSAGVLSQRGPARTAGRTILSGRSQVTTRAFPPNTGKRLTYQQPLRYWLPKR